MNVARRGASLAAERVGAERGQESEAQPNREGEASGSATEILDIYYKTKKQALTYDKSSNSRFWECW